LYFSYRALASTSSFLSHNSSTLRKPFSAHYRHVIFTFFLLAVHLSLLGYCLFSNSRRKEIPAIRLYGPFHLPHCGKTASYFLKVIVVFPQSFNIKVHIPSSFISPFCFRQFPVIRYPFAPFFTRFNLHQFPPFPDFQAGRSSVLKSKTHYQIPPFSKSCSPLRLLGHGFSINTILGQNEEVSPPIFFRFMLTKTLTSCVRLYDIFPPHYLFKPWCLVNFLPPPIGRYLNLYRIFPILYLIPPPLPSSNM